MEFTATYSPDDNKLRLYASARLDADTYARVKAAGFRWAPKQDLFVAPMWTPDREDLCIELAGEIDDEDTSLVERAEERADRFTDYHHARAADADAAHKAVSAIADGIPLGQPILIGHHSERRARRDAEKIQDGMRRAIRMWDTAQYWRSRATGAIQHAKYKERPDVRARRIKGIEADKRKRERQKADAAAVVQRFAVVDQVDKWKPREDGSLPTREERAYYVAGRLSGGPYCAIVRTEGPNATTLHYSAYDVLAPDDKRYSHCPAMTVDEVQAKFEAWKADTDAYCDRWIAHYENRLSYERAMLEDAGGTKADQTEPEHGGACRCWATDRGRDRWSWIVKVNKVSVTVLDNWGNGGTDFTRTIPFDKLTAVMSAAAVNQARAEGRIVQETSRGFALLETAPDRGTEPTRNESPRSPEPEQVEVRHVNAVGAGARVVAPTSAGAPVPDAAAFDALRQTLKAGVQVVSAPQLFPTPAAVAARLVELAEVRLEHRILEPSAGTGRIIRALQEKLGKGADLVAVEIRANLAETVLRGGLRVPTHCTDFLATNGELGTFDRIVMNPPFQNADDIKHIEHARKLLNPGGRLVAVCANGPRQGKWFEEHAGPSDRWIPLDAGTFVESGTNVNAAIVVLEA